MDLERYNKIDRIAEAAVEFPADERASFLDSECGGDEELRREVESLILRRQEAGSFLEEPALKRAAELMADERGHSFEGQTIGNYQIERRIGAGGMGEVYLAHDRSLDRAVAIKIVSADSTENVLARKRLVREARAAAKLDHANICSVYEVAEQNGLTFIVMQYVEGETLAERIARKPMPIEEMLDIAAQVADGLAEAHSHGIIHRDIKPHNIMLTPRHQAKVMDFGLAEVVRDRSKVESEAVTESLLFEPGVIVGTVPYMSPEQLRAEAIDSRSDIFSFGCVLYEMLSSHQPFEGESVANTISAILTQEPPPLIRYSSEAPAELQRIITKALRKDRQERYQTMRDMFLDLKSLKNDFELQSRLARAAASDWGNKVLDSAGSGLAAGSRPQPPSIAVLPFTNTSADAENEYFCDGLAEELLHALTKVEGLKVAARTSAFSVKGKNIDIREIGQKLNVTALLEGSVRKAGNRLRITAQLINVTDGYHLWSERFDRDLADVFAIQDEITLAIVDALKVRLLDQTKTLLLKRHTENAEVYQLYLKGRYYWNRITGESLKKAIEYFSRAIEEDPCYALAYCGLADSYGVLVQNYLGPKDSYQKAKAAALRALEIDETLAEAHVSLAMVKLMCEWDFPGAETELKRALELNAGYASLYEAYGYCLQAMGQTDAAIARLEQASELDPLSPVITSDLGFSYISVRQYDRALEKGLKALEIEPNFAVAHLVIGIAYECKGEHEKAIAALAKASALSNESPRVLARLGYAYAKEGSTDKARELLDRLIRHSEQSHIDPYNIAVVRIGLGESEEAFESLGQAYEERSAQLIWLNLDPSFDNLRSDPRFADLLRRVGNSGGPARE